MRITTKRILFVVLVAILAFVFHTLNSTGFFRTVKNYSKGKTIKVVPIKGAEDMTISYTDSFAIISATNREVYPPKKEEKGALYLMNLDTQEFNTVLLTQSFNQPFAPHGITMLKKDSTYTIMAINHTTTGHSIEVFGLVNNSLSFKKSITHASLKSPNDLVMLNENQFYFTNDHGYTEGIGKVFEEYLGLAVSNVIYFDGNEFTEVAKGIAYANGINFDPTRNLVYVASPREFAIKVYTRNEDGTLAFIEDIPCETGVDNIEIDQNGNLWTAGHPNLLRFKSYAKGKKDTAPSEILKITYRGKNDYTVEQIYVNDGSEMSGSSVATSFKNLVLTGNVMDDHFLILKRSEE